MRPFLRLENEQKSCAIWVYSFLEIALIKFDELSVSFEAEGFFMGLIKSHLRH